MGKKIAKTGVTCTIAMDTKFKNGAIAPLLKYI